MRLKFIFWIMCLLVGFYAQGADSRAQDCTDKQYSKGNRCCNKCGPGLRVVSHCTDTEDTKCNKCFRDEYQPGWTEERRCRQQKFCDTEKGFMERTENLEAEEPCRCRPGFQCCPINCEYCERIPTCGAGFGLEVEIPDSANGRKVCVPCKKGFFSDENSAEPCKQWTNCKAEGRSEKKPGSPQADAVCGVQVPAASPSSWVIVSVLSVITVLCLLILLLFCYKDKLKLLSVNLRSCVQNLKRTRIQQETLAPLYHSGAGGGPGGPRCTPCETTKLVCQAPQSPTDETPYTLPGVSSPDVRVSLPLTVETEGAGTKVVEDQSEGSGEPQEVSEDEEVVSTSPLLAGSCVCVIPIREPLEVGENEDCSQAVSPGTLGTCSCGGLDSTGLDESGKAERGDGGGAPKREKMVLSKSDTGGASLVSMSPPLLHTSSVVPPSGPLPDCRAHPADRSAVRQEDFYRLGSADSTSTESSTTSSMTSVSPLVTSSSVGDLYLDKPAEQSQGLSWGESKGNKLCSVVSDLECAPESLHSQLAEPTPTSGQVSGSHNTTFISSGQVMNFSGDVIVVYVSQTSQSSDGAGQDEAFPGPAQKETSETAQFFPSCRTSQDETLPVQEVMDERLLGK